VILEQELADTEVLGSLERIVALLLKQDIAETHRAVLSTLSDPLYADQGLATGLSEETLTLDEVVDRVSEYSLARSVLAYLEYLRSGNDEQLVEAAERVRSVTALALEARFVDVWWWGRVIEKLFDELQKTSLWSNLRPLMPVGGDSAIIRGYIIAAMQRNVCTLWPSQLTALKKVAEVERPSFCVRMPTSAGKTRIAELAILAAFNDHVGQGAKCIYIAPFRSLAVEVERSLRAAFAPLGFSVSELYGGFELSDAENAVIESVSIVVVTPEKLDAMLRFSPQIFESVKCVIVDEGHIAGDRSERGLRAEFVLNRLLRRLPRDSCRYVFASAVLPNADDFAKWIGGNDESLVTSEWRPSRQMIGELRWRADAPTKIVYTHAGHKPFETDCFVPRFIEQEAGIGRRRRAYPAHAREAVALSAVRLSSQGPVLLFVPQRQHVESTGKAVLEAITLEQTYSPSRSVAHLGADINAPEVTACINALDQQLGANSTLAQCVRKGIAVHHGRLPWQIRQPMENFIGSGHAQIIVATTTLSAGVNLPIRTVLVKGLWQGEKKLVNALTFWNICGRAGRGMKEIEGQILFFMDLNRPTWQTTRDRSYNLNLIEQPNAESIMGVLYFLLAELKRHWLQQIPEVSFEAMCEKLANSDFDWMADDDAEGMKAWFRLLDDQLFALLSEHLEDGELADTLESVLSDSLLSVQLASKPIQGIDLEAASKSLSARMDYVRFRIPERIQRDRFYKLGLPIEDCLQLHGSLVELTELLVEFAHWNDLELEDKCDWISRFVAWAVTLPFAQVADERRDSLATLTVEFLKGTSLTEMGNQPSIAAIWPTPQEIGAEIESFCGFRLSWIANAVANYVQVTAAADIQIPSIAAALPAMFKYGTMRPLATTFAPFLENDRVLGELLADLCPAPYGDNAVFAWFRELTIDDLVGNGIEQPQAERILNSRNHILRVQAPPAQEPANSCQLETIQAFGLLGDYPLVNAISKVNDDGQFIELVSPSGELIGQFRPIGHPFFEGWFRWMLLSLKLNCTDGTPVLSWSTLA
jgi:hypothetical protein